jgi:hypothetical protein
MITEHVRALFIVCDEIFHAMVEDDDVTMEGYLTRVHTIKEQKKSLPYLISMSALRIFLFTAAFISLNPTS